jgi:hypothetical protein
MRPTESAMGIDSIGKKGPPTPPPGGAAPGRSTGARRADETGRPFEVAKKADPHSPSGPHSTSVRDPATGEAQRAGGAESVQPTPTALERLRAGEIDVHGYVDLKVDEATRHLAALPPSQLQQVRAALRERIASDPGLVELVRTATGSVPQPPADE